MKAPSAPPAAVDDYGQPVANPVALPPPGYAQSMEKGGNPPPGAYGQQPMEVTAEPIPMQGASVGIPEFAVYQNMFVAQTRKGCLQECMGCDAQSEFFIGTLDMPKARNFYAIEKSDCCIRLCLKGLRPFDMQVFSGDREDANNLVAQYHRPCNCHVNACKCCCFQEISAVSRTGQFMGLVKEKFWCCVPDFAVTNDQALHEYNIHMPVCCGCLPDICKEGCCRFGFYIYPADAEGKDASDQEVGKIVKVWSGMYNELLTDADKFELHFPAGVSDTTKANLLGGVFLLNQLFFEDKNNNNN